MPSKKKKYNARFPPARIKKIMQIDEEVGKVAATVPVIISRALELFIESLIVKTNEVTRARNARTMSVQHLKSVIGCEPRFDFLAELVSQYPDVAQEEEGDGPSGAGAPSDAPAKRPYKRSAKSKTGDGGQPQKRRRGTGAAEKEDSETDSDDENSENKFTQSVFVEPARSSSSKSGAHSTASSTITKPLSDLEPTPWAMKIETKPEPERSPLCLAPSALPVAIESLEPSALPVSIESLDSVMNELISARGEMASRNVSSQGEIVMPTRASGISPSGEMGTKCGPMMSPYSDAHSSPHSDTTPRGDMMSPGAEPSLTMDLKYALPHGSYGSNTPHVIAPVSPYVTTCVPSHVNTNTLSRFATPTHAVASSIMERSVTMELPHATSPPQPDLSTASPVPTSQTYSISTGLSHSGSHQDTSASLTSPQHTSSATLMQPHLVLSSPSGTMLNTQDTAWQRLSGDDMRDQQMRIVESLGHSLPIVSSSLQTQATANSLTYHQPTPMLPIAVPPPQHTFVLPQRQHSSPSNIHMDQPSTGQRHIEQRRSDIQQQNVATSPPNVKYETLSDAQRQRSSDSVRSQQTPRKRDDDTIHYSPEPNPVPRSSAVAGYEGTTPGDFSRSGSTGMLPPPAHTHSAQHPSSLVYPGFYSPYIYPEAFSPFLQGSPTSMSVPSTGGIPITMGIPFSGGIPIPAGISNAVGIPNIPGISVPTMVQLGSPETPQSSGNGHTPGDGMRQFMLYDGAGGPFSPPLVHPLAQHPASKGGHR